VDLPVRIGRVLRREIQVIDGDHGRTVRPLGEAVGQMLLGEEHGHGRILDHQRQPLLRILRIERHPAAPRLEHGEEHQGHFQRALDADAHRHLGADAQPPQAAGQPVRPVVQLREAEPLIAEQHGRRVRGPAGLLGDQVEDGRRRAGVALIPVHQNLVPLLRREHLQLADAATRLRQSGRQQGLEVGGHAGDRRLLVQVGAVLEVAAEAARRLHHVESQVELREPALDAQRRQRQARHLERAARCVLESKHDLEQRVVREVAVRLQLLHQLLERQVRVGEDGQGLGAYAGKQIPEARIPRHIGAHQQRARKTADDAFQLRTVTVGGRDAHYEVSLPRIAEEQQVEHGEQRDERGRARRLRERL
jgi:hypothetical protein